MIRDKKKIKRPKTFVLEECIVDPFVAVTMDTVE